MLIARALAADPEVLFLDEPTAGVDREAETAIIALIAELNRERGMTVVLVSHHLGRIRSAVRSVVVGRRRAGRTARRSPTAAPGARPPTRCGPPLASGE